MSTTVSQIAYDESVRALGQQATVLEGVRARAGILLAAASVTTGFFGGIALRDTAFGGVATAAVIFYAGADAALIAILWPRGEWYFRASAGDILGHAEASGDTVTAEEAHGELARQLEDAYCKNEKKLNPLFGLLRAGTILLGLEVVLWVVQLGR